VKQPEVTLATGTGPPLGAGSFTTEDAVRRVPGFYWGLRADSMRAFAPGDYLLRIAMEGYFVVERQVSIKAGTATPVQVRLGRLAPSSH